MPNNKPVLTFAVDDKKVWDAICLEMANELGPQCREYDVMDFRPSDSAVDITFSRSGGALPPKTFRFKDLEVTQGTFPGNWQHFLDQLHEFGEYPWSIEQLLQA